MEAIGKLCLGLILGTVSALWTSFVLQDLWNRFVRPLGVASLSYWHANGLAIFIGFISSTYFLRILPDEPDETFGHTAAITLARCFIAALALGMGALAHSLAHV